MGYDWPLHMFINPEDAAPEVIENTRFATMPKWEGKNHATNNVAHLMCMEKASKKKNAAWAWLNWVSNPQLEVEIVKASESNILMHTANQQDPDMNDDYNNFFRAILEGLKVGKEFPDIPEWAECSAILSAAITNIVNGKPEKAALDEAAADIETILKKAGYYN
jgi:multiple sugar transport system substrate-binding protein